MVHFCFTSFSRSAHSWGTNCAGLVWDRSQVDLSEASLGEKKIKVFPGAGLGDNFGFKRKETNERTYDIFTMHVSYVIETFTGIPMMTATSATGFVLCAWFFGPEKRVASSRRFLKETLDQPNARKIGHQTGSADVFRRRGVARRLQFWLFWVLSSMYKWSLLSEKNLP